MDNCKRLYVFRLLLVTILAFFCIGLEYFFHFVLEINIVYTQLFYAPIVLAALWWGLKGGLYASLFLSLSYILANLYGIEASIFVRVFGFIFIGSVVGTMSNWYTKTEIMLQENKAQKTSILEAIPYAVIGLHKRRIVFANKGAETVFGWKPEGLIGLTTELLYRTEEEFEEIDNRFYPVLEKQRTYSDEFICRHKDGRDIVCMINASRIGESLVDEKIVVVYEDITKYRKKPSE